MNISGDKWLSRALKITSFSCFAPYGMIIWYQGSMPGMNLRLCKCDLGTGEFNRPLPPLKLTLRLWIWSIEASISITDSTLRIFAATRFRSGFLPLYVPGLKLTRRVLFDGTRSSCSIKKKNMDKYWCTGVGTISKFYYIVKTLL